MSARQRKDSLKMFGARGRVILCIALAIPAAQLAAQPASSDSEEPGVFPATPNRVETQLEIEWDANSPAMGEDEQPVGVSPQEIALLIAERERYKDPAYSLFRERLSNLVAGAVIGTLIAVSVRALFNVGASATVN